MANAAEEPDVPSPLHEGPPSLLDVLPMHRGGYVVDEERARESPCLQRELKRGGTITFSEGIVGPLDEEQVALYCGAGIERLVLTPKQEARLEQFAEAAHACKAEETEPKGQRFPEYLACMERELRAREPEQA